MSKTMTKELWEIARDAWVRSFYLGPCSCSINEDIAGGWQAVVNSVISEHERRKNIDPYAELKAAAKDPTKQIRLLGGTWRDANSDWAWSSSPVCYEIRDKPKSMRKVKLLAWFNGKQLFWNTDLDSITRTHSKRVPSEDKEIEVEE